MSATHFGNSDARSGLRVYTSAQANTTTAYTTPMTAYATTAAMQSGYATSALADGSSNNNNNNNNVAYALTQADRSRNALAHEGGSSKHDNSERRSGSKRTHEQAFTGDMAVYATTHATATTATTMQQEGVYDHAAVKTNEVVEVLAPPQKKKKVTYALPHQNMEEGHFYVVLGEDIDVSTQRFKILSLLGEGTFGKVVEAWDRKRKEYCAVKIVRNVPKYTRDAKIEIQFMEKVRQADPSDHMPIMKIQRYFQNDSAHMCIVMPKYGPCLLDWIMKHGPLSHRHLAQVIFFCGVALDFFHSELHLMHTDLKPENILLETTDTATDPVTNRVAPPDPCQVRLCDLGGCCDERHSRTAIVSTRHYRSPEVILGLGWMYSTDMWSMGCIIYELYTGRLLYDTHDNSEHLHLMERTLGRLPPEWAARCGTDEARALYNSAGQLRPCTDPKHLARIARTRMVHEVVRDDLLLDLILGLLSYDRQRRLNARQMTTHPYVLKYYPEARQHHNYPDNRVSLRPPPIM